MGRIYFIHRSQKLQVGAAISAHGGNLLWISPTKLGEPSLGRRGRAKSVSLGGLDRMSSLTFVANLQRGTVVDR